jgi:hypothetical protein
MTISSEPSVRFPARGRPAAPIRASPGELDRFIPAAEPQLGREGVAAAAAAFANSARMNVPGAGKEDQACSTRRRVV